VEHIGIYLSNSADKDFIIDEILANRFLKNHVDLSVLQGELFSNITINRMIDEELKHDHFLITSNENHSLMSMSSGQQRKALLNYIISRQPQYIVLDDLFSSIDTETQTFITKELTQLSQSVLLIQLFYRRHDALPFIQTVLSVDSENRIVNKQPLNQFSAIDNLPHPVQPVALPHLFTNPTPAINPLVQLNSVSAKYEDKKVLKDISWTIRSGEFWQLKGPNGSGKSTLLSMITGDNARGYGEDMILFGKKKGTGETVWDIRKNIGYFNATMTQQFYRNDSVENMIISGFVDSIGLYTKPGDLQRDIANAWMQVLGPTFRNKRFRSLSFGQQRIVLVVRALVKHPPLLILDEPTVGLDDENTQLFINLISAIASQRKVAIIYVSHRSEPEMNPDKIFELRPTPEGSTGHVVINTQENQHSKD